MSCDTCAESDILATGCEEGGRREALNCTIEDSARACPCPSVRGTPSPFHLRFNQGLLGTAALVMRVKSISAFGSSRGPQDIAPFMKDKRDYNYVASVTEHALDQT